MGLLETTVLASAVAWGSGISVYGTAFLLGILGFFGVMDLPAGLEVLAHPTVLGFLILLYSVEFGVDKIPGIDSLNDLIHTFIRIPGGALLAAGVAGGLESDAAGPAAVAAFLGGGMIATISHILKTGTRAMVNMSPEPFSNWIVSTFEQILLVVGFLLALTLPLAFLAVGAATVVLAVWLAPKVWNALFWLFGDHRRTGIRFQETSRPPGPPSGGDAPFLSNP